MRQITCQHLAHTNVVVKARHLLRVTLVICLIARDLKPTGGARGAPASSTGRLPELPGGYLFPSTLFGPNNQVTGIQEVLLLGRLLNRTVILPPIIHHHYDSHQSKEEHWRAPDFNFSQIFDVPHLARHQSVMTLEEHKAAGWDGKLDAVVYGCNENVLWVSMRRYYKHGISDAIPTMMKLSLDCSNTESFSKSAQAIAEYRYVAIVTYEDVVVQAGHTTFSGRDKTRCLQIYFQVTGDLRKSPDLLALVAAFRDKYLGGRNSSYMAVHVRPFPDRCLKLWLDGYDPDTAKTQCDNYSLYEEFVPQTLAMMRKHGIEQSSHALFVMVHPVLRPLIQKRYSAAGLHPVFFHEHDMEAALGFKSLSLMGMLEQEVCVTATAFRGTGQSSMTGIIQQDRTASGMAASSTTSFSTVPPNNS